MPFINKKINKEIMKRSRLRNKFLNTISDIDRKTYNKQCNLCAGFIRSEKKNFVSNINASDITDNKPFGRRKTFLKLFLLTFLGDNFFSMNVILDFVFILSVKNGFTSS